MNRTPANAEQSKTEHHLGYAPAYHLARLHRASGTLCWCVAMGLILGWLVALPSFGSTRPILNFAVLLALLLLLLPWSVASAKSAWRLTDPWPEPSRAGLIRLGFRALAVASPLAVLCFGLLIAAMRMAGPPVIGSRNQPIAAVAVHGVPVLTVAVLGLLALAAIGLWLRAGFLVGRAGVGQAGSAVARLRIGIGLLAGVVGVIGLVALDLFLRHRMGSTDFVATAVLLVCGLLAVLFGWTFGALHARLCVLIGAIERAEDEVRRSDRNRLGVLPGDPSVNEASATPPLGEDRSQDEIGPIGGHPDPPGL